MAEGRIRVNKVLKDYNIGLSTLTDFLKKKGINDELTLTSKISEDVFALVAKEFGKEQLIKEQSQKVSIKLKEITDVESNRSNAEEEEPVKEVIIKTNVFTEQKKVESPAPKAEPEPEVRKNEPAPEEKKAPSQPEAPRSDLKIVGHIDLTPKKKAEPAQQPKPEKEEKPADTQAKAEAPKETAAEKVEKAEKTEKREERPVIEHIETRVEKLAGPKTVGTIDLSKFEKKPSAPAEHGKKDKNKRERIHKGAAKVDISNPKNNLPGRQDGKAQKDGGRGKAAKKGGDRFKAVRPEFDSDEIQKQIKETYARMTEVHAKTKTSKHRREKREEISQKMQEEQVRQEMTSNVLKVTEFVTVNELAILMNNTPVTKVIEACMNLGLMVSINQRLDAEALVLVAEEFGYKIEFVTAEIQGAIAQEEDKEEDLLPRPPIVTVMGHVDHGKTSLLDYIRKAHVAAGESGGITQHIGAYQVERQGRAITFLDTPGHEAFTAMRARGANLTDIAVIVIAADDGIMPQTKEAIQHAQAAKVAMIVAINKCDLRTANPDRVKRQLQQMGLAPEDWGGDLICCNVSAQTGEGIDQLLEMILLQAEMLELKANPRCKATGYVIESCLEAGRGPTATVLVKNGTLQLNDAVVSGSCWGRIKAMINDQGHKVRTAPPSAAVKLLGLTSVPMPGSEFVVYKNDREARQVAESRAEAARLEALSDKEPAHSGPLTLADLLQAQAGSDKRKLSVILKTDVQGSLEALQGAMEAIKSEKVDLEIVGTGVGNVSVNDVLLATASQAVILGFHVAKDNGAGAEAKRRGVEIRLYSIIYEMLDDVKNLMTGLLDPIIKEHVNGHASIRQIFDMGKRGKVAGCMCMKGKVTLKGRVRVKRKDEILYEGKIQSLRRFQNEASEVREGQECGIVLDHFTNFVEGDVIESYEVEKVAQSL